jgi:hypothetical protein
MTHKITAQDIRYAITGKDEAKVSITVKYWIDGYDFSLEYNLDLPIDTERGAVPDAVGINAHIMHFAPVGQLQQMLDRFMTAVLVDMSEVDALIELHKTTPGNDQP